MAQIIPVILCGGSGTRLWPLSRKKTPKQFLKLMDEYSLLQQTARRAIDILGVSGTELVAVTLDSLRDETVRQLQEISPALTRHVLCEPEARNTAAATALALHYVREQFGEDSFMWILPADHYVGNEACLRQAVHSAVSVASDGYMVTFGIKPTRPEIGYGYIRQDKALNDQGAYCVSGFFEKPDRRTAVEFINSGDYLWSSGMHLFRTGVAQENFIRHAPHTWEVVKKSVISASNPLFPALSPYAFARSEPFETAVIEKAERIAVIPCDPQWSDIGSWESLWEIKQKDASGNALDGNVLCHATTNSMIMAHDRLIACVGMKDIIVIETHDSILIADKKSNQSIKELVSALQEMKRDETVYSSVIHHGWGGSRIIAEAGHVSMREVVLKPGQSMGRNLSPHKSQWWVLSGKAEFTVDDGRKAIMEKSDTLPIAENSIYEISNKSGQICKLLELKYGETEQGVSLPLAGTISGLTMQADMKRSSTVAGR